MRRTSLSTSPSVPRCRTSPSPRCCWRAPASSAGASNCPSASCLFPSKFKGAPMPAYKKSDARAWARQYLTGCSAVTLPSYSADLKRLNERGIRHDVERAVKQGFSYTLLCSEVAITAEENAQFTAWARDSAAGKLGLFFHAAFGTLADNIEAVKLAE